MRTWAHAIILPLCHLGILNALQLQAIPQDFPPNPIHKPGWILIAHDEFDAGPGGELDLATWIDGYFPGRFGDDYDNPKMPPNCEFRREADTGFIVLKTLASRPRAWAAGIATFNTANWHKRYENARIHTMHKFSSKYGYFEVRSRHPVAVTGKHAAWWILDTHPGGEEIDVYEDSAYGGPNFHLDAMGPPLDGMGADYPVTKRPRDIVWRIYGMEIHKTGIRFCLNNRLIHERSADWSGIKAWAHILSLYARDSHIDNEYHVDYFRAYRRISE